MRDGRTLVSRDVSDTALKQRFSYGQNAFATELLTIAQA